MLQLESVTVNAIRGAAIRPRTPHREGLVADGYRFDQSTLRPKHRCFGDISLVPIGGV